jgi:hypothetical protein
MRSERMPTMRRGLQSEINVELTMRRASEPGNHLEFAT